MGIGPFFKRRVLDSIAIITSLLVTLICLLLVFKAPLVYWFGNHIPIQKTVVGIGFVIDLSAALLATLASLLTLCVFIYCWHYFEAAGNLFHALVLIFLGGMLGFCFTSDLFNLFVFFELMSISAYALTGYKNESRSSLQGSLNFVVTNSLGGILILLGIGFTYSQTGALNFAQVGNLYIHQSMNGSMVASFILITSGFLIKAAIVPFHFWLADAHTVAPTPISVLFSGIMAQLGLYGLARIYWTMFAKPSFPLEHQFLILFFTIGALTILVGSMMCFMERSLKRMLAFSTISNSGVMLIGLSSLTPIGLQGLIYYIFAHGLLKAILFMCVGILLHHFGSVDELELWRKGKAIPLIGVLFFIATIGLCGFPVWGVFTAKNLIELSLPSFEKEMFIFLILFETLLTGGALIRASGRIFIGFGKHQTIHTPVKNITQQQETEHTKKATPITMLIPITILMVTLLVLNTFTQFNVLLNEAAQEFQNQRWYSSVVFNQPPPPLYDKPLMHTSSNYLIELIGVFGAVLVGLLALFGHRCSQWLKNIVTILIIPPSMKLKSLQSGLINDYVSWIILSITLISFLCSCHYEAILINHYFYHSLHLNH
ncbi:formate hydrogenlyase, subunit 3/multisubunit Na+/H+ antiporter [Legionella oakridgensis ATCC 33761 = DSM 21215]|uniref:Formate hydrogenlyase, subunit 3/multisubunit Na+/H+ antiporter n=1 Tax=Legionella oakridgensis ATCC 33761 = DSM 21215 TaxID=1268635 RepID=W0B9L7_9GAMM|nr:proton-conducting transporter membrane subunit [Legionella oakridgensis]AHE67238.1 formate hydrogenlyase, subunit 3/multisubunit Na+/H+ antiporter [Legionella oakridgensis ATCC 33761 = DSM 21215]